MASPSPLCILFIVLASTPVLAATKDAEQPDKEMLRMMDFLRDMEILKQMQMMQDMEGLERFGEQVNTAPQKTVPARKKGAAR